MHITLTDERRLHVLVNTALRDGISEREFVGLLQICFIATMFRYHSDQVVRDALNSFRGHANSNQLQDVTWNQILHTDMVPYYELFLTMLLQDDLWTRVVAAASGDYSETMLDLEVGDDLDLLAWIREWELELSGRSPSAIRDFIRGTGTSRPDMALSTGEAHNLSIKYRGCYGTIGDKVFRVRDFYTGERQGVMVRYELSSAEGRHRLEDEEFNPSRHKFFTSDLGWVKWGDHSYYSQYVVGTYLRGLGEQNFQLRFKYSAVNGIETISEDFHREGLIKAYLQRKMDNIPLAIQANQSHIQITPEIVLLVREFTAGRKYFLITSNRCAGELSDDRTRIDLYPAYSSLLPTLEKVIPYEIR